MSAIGLTLCDIAALGISTVTSIPYSISGAFGWDFPNTMFVVNVGFFCIQSLIKLKIGAWQWRDMLQIPCTLLVSSLLKLFEILIVFQVDALWERILVALLAILIMGVGIAITVNMNLAPVPSDAIVHAISMASCKSLGTTKNVVDAVCISLSAAIDLIGSGRISSVGLTTVLCMVLLGRVIAVFEYFCKERVRRVAGLEPTAKS